MATEDEAAALVAFDFSDQFEAVASGFVGREWLFDRVDQWIAKPAGRLLLILGGPGTGKTAFAARLAVTRRDVAAAHFCSSEDSRTIRPSTAIRSIAANLAAALPNYGECLANTVDPARLSIRVDIRVTAANRVAAVVINHLHAPAAADELDILLLAPLSILPAPAGTVVVVIDALDEALTHSEDENLVTLLCAARGFPSWLRLVCTSRPDDRVRGRLNDPDVVDLESEPVHAIDDVRRYAGGRIHAITSAAPERADQARTLLSRLNAIEPNFLYAKLVIDDFSLNPDYYSDETLSAADSAVPSTLEDLFLRFLNRLPGSHWGKIHQRVLGALCVAREPVQEPVLASLTGLTVGAIRRGTVALSQFLRRKRTQDGPDSLSLFHPSFARFLTDPAASGAFFCDPVEENQRIVAHALGRAASLEQAASADAYLHRHVVAHLVGAGDLAHLESLLGSYTWLYDKVQRLGVEAAIADYETSAIPGASKVAAVLRQVAHIVAMDRSQIAGQILARLGGSDAPLVITLLGRVVGAPGLAWLRPLNAQQTESTLRQTLKLRGSVEGLALSADGATGVIAVDSRLVLVDIDSGRELRTFHEHTSGITAVGIAEDGATFASAGKDGLRIWSAQGPIHRLDWHVDQNSPVAMADGLVFAVCDAPRPPGSRAKLRCWDSRGRKEELLPFAEQEGSEEILAARGGYVIAPFRRNAIVWRARHPAEHYEVKEPSPGFGCNVDLTADGRWLAYAGNDHRVVVWDVRADREHRVLVPARDPGEKAFQRLAFCDHGRTLAMLSYDFEEVLRPPWLCAWDVESGRLVFETTCHADQAVEMASATDAHRVITGTISGEVRIWNLGAAVPVAHVSPHRERITQLVGAGREVISGGEDGRIAIWNTTDGRMLRTWEAHTAAISSLDVSPKRHRLFSSGLDGHIRVWDTATGEVTDEIAWEGCVPEKICSLDEDTLLCFGDDGRIGRWSRTKRRWTKDHSSTGYGGVVTGICSDATRSRVAFVSAPGRKMWVGTADGLLYQVVVWGVREREVLAAKHYRGREHSPVPGISPDGKCIYAAQSHSIEALTMPDGDLAGTYHHEDDVTYIAIAPSGLHLATATNGGLVRVWHESTHTSVADFGLDAVVTAMTFADGDSTLCVGTETGDVLMFQLVE